MKTLCTKEIMVNEIEVGERLRQIDGPWVEVLAASITENGLQQHIQVMELAGKPVLVAGAHRLAAVKMLDWKKIPAHVVAPQTDNPALEARLLEIDENLFRRDLRGLDRMRSLAERKEIYLEVFPETKHGGDGKTKRAKNQNDILSFSKDTAEKTGFSNRTVERDIATYRALSSTAVDMLNATSFAEKAADVKAIAALDHEDQIKVLDLALPIGGMDLQSAINYVTGKKTISGADKVYQSAIGNLSRLTPKRQKDVLRNFPDLIAEIAKEDGLI